MTRYCVRCRCPTESESRGSALVCTSCGDDRPTSGGLVLCGGRAYCDHCGADVGALKGVVR